MSYISDLADSVAVSVGGSIEPEWILAQWMHETNGFTSELCHESHNLGGLTQVSDNGDAQPDGSLFYMVFKSAAEFAEYFAWYLLQYDGIQNCDSLETYITCLNFGGYFGDSYDNYLAGCRRWLVTIQ